MCKLGGAISAAVLLLSGSVAARCEALRCSNTEATHAIDDEVAGMLARASRMFSRNAKETIDPSKVSATVSDTYEEDHTEATKDCHGHLAVGYDGAKAEAEIDYQIIQTDEGKIITKWPRDEQFAIGLVEQLVLQKALAEQQVRTPSAR